MQMNKNTGGKHSKILERAGLEMWKELITQSRDRLFKTCWKNYKVPLHVYFSKNVRTLLKSHIHIFNVLIFTVQNLENVKQEM
jgi:hypothetical protein